jgi:hypothetical protein
MDQNYNLDNNEKQQIKSFYFNQIIYNIFSILSVITYIITLKGCNKTQNECLKDYPLSLIQKIFSLTIISGLLFSYQLYLVFIVKKVSKVGLIIASSILLYLTVIYDTQSNFSSHGAYNRIGLAFGIILGILFYFTTQLYYFHKGFTIGSICLLLCVISLQILHVTYTSCDGWITGFKSTKMKNGICYLETPSICYKKIFDGWLDVTKISGVTCENERRDSRSIFEYGLRNNHRFQDKSKLKNTKRFAFPRTESYPIFPDSTNWVFQDNVLNGIKNYDLLTKEEKDKNEVYLDYESTPPKVNLEVKYDETLSKERNSIPNEELKFERSKPLTKNILFFFIDSMSRVDFKRKLPKLFEYLENKFDGRSNKEKFNQKEKQGSNNTKKSDLEVFQFFKYHGVGKYTGLNMCATMFGSYYNEVGNGQHIIKFLKKSGFVTGQAQNFCGREAFDIESGAIESFEWDNYDHELESLFCEPNYRPINADYYVMTGHSSIKIRCLYSRQTIEYALDYTLDFFRKYKNNKKFFRVGIIDAHEGTNEVIKYTDEIMTNFFIQMEKEGFFNDTAVFIHSDHGLSVAGPFSFLDLEDWRVETLLPNLMLMLPTNVDNYELYRDNLKKNENNIVNPFNVYNSMLAMSGYSDKMYKNDEFDLFKKIQTQHRKCTFIVTWDVCRCK